MYNSHSLHTVAQPLISPYLKMYLFIVKSKISSVNVFSLHVLFFLTSRHVTCTMFSTLGKLRAAWRIFFLCPGSVIPKSLRSWSSITLLPYTCQKARDTHTHTHMHGCRQINTNTRNKHNARGTIRRMDSCGINENQSAIRHIVQLFKCPDAQTGVQYLHTCGKQLVTHSTLQLPGGAAL